MSKEKMKLDYPKVVKLRCKLTRGLRWMDQVKNDNAWEEIVNIKRERDGGIFVIDPLLKRTQ